MSLFVNITENNIFCIHMRLDFFEVCLIKKYFWLNDFKRLLHVQHLIDYLLPPVGDPNLILSLDRFIKSTHSCV